MTTNSQAIRDEVRRIGQRELKAQYCYLDQALPVEWDDMGSSSRLDELQAAVLRLKLRHLDGWNTRRQAHAQTYARLLQGVPIVIPAERDGESHVYHHYVIQAPDRDRTSRALLDRGISIRVPSVLPAYRRLVNSQQGRLVGDLPVNERVIPRAISLPMYPELEPEQLAYVAESLREVLHA